MKVQLASNTSAFMRDERGLVTHLALVVTILVLIFGGMALDTSNARLTRSVLQTAADAAAQAGILDLPDQATALTSALEIANSNLTGASINSAITSERVAFGRWSERNQTFVATTTNPNAIKITATRSAANSNPVPTFLLKMAGFSSWNIETHSISFRDVECQTADISTNGTFSITSNNEFYNSFCVSANEISLNNNNHFDDDNRFYVPSFSDITFNGGTSMASIIGRGTDNSDAGLTYADIVEESTDYASSYTMDVDTLGDFFLDPSFADQPSYINTSAAVIQIAAKNVKYTSFIPGRIYEVTCGGSDGTKAQFFNGAVVQQIVMVSECKIQIGTTSVLEDVILVSRDTSNKSVYAASKVQLGTNDACAEGGGVKIYAAGDFSSAAKLEAYGAFISTVGSVSIAAKSGGIAGIEIQANGDVSFSAQASFGSCKTDENSSLELSYRLVE